MAQYFFKTPFANTGDVATIPRPTQVDGSVSFEKGFPTDYQLDPDTEPTAKDVPRDQFNELMNYITGALQIIQIHGFPDFITTSDNDGSPYEYAVNATVRFTGGWAGAGALNYYSLVDTNTADPTDSTKWGLVSYQSYETPGVVKMYDGSTLPTGYVWSNGTTIGNAASNATGRANADTSALFTVLWNSFTSGVLPIYDSTGTLTTRGASAAADFAANKAIATVDRCGRASIGADNMGGITAKGRITTAGCGIDGSVLGASGGAQNVSLSAAQNGSHSHAATTSASGVHYHDGTTGSSGSHTHTVTQSNVSGSGGIFGFGIQAFTINGSSTTIRSGVINSSGIHTHGFSTDNAGSHTHPVTVDSQGSGTAHLNAQPSIMSNFIVALGTA